MGACSVCRQVAPQVAALKRQIQVALKEEDYEKA